MTGRWTVPAGGGPADAAYYAYDLDGDLEVIKEESGSSLTYFEHGAHGLVTKIKPIGGTEVTLAHGAASNSTQRICPSGDTAYYE